MVWLLLAESFHWGHICLLHDGPSAIPKKGTTAHGHVTSSLARLGSLIDKHGQDANPVHRYCARVLRIISHRLPTVSHEAVRAGAHGRFCGLSSLRRPPEDTAINTYKTYMEEGLGKGSKPDF